MDAREYRRAFDLPRWNRLCSVALPCTQGEPRHWDPSCPPFATTRYRYPAAQGPCRAVPRGTIDDV